jgi:membrane protease YdiL (CAAX protease family)
MMVQCRPAKALLPPLPGRTRWVRALECGGAFFVLPAVLYGVRHELAFRMGLYPVLAAAPQELIFRAFFFHRYAPIFPGPASLLAANALSFGLAHLLYANWIAVVLSTLGGLLFASRYWRTGSLLVVSLEHGLWGDLLFTVGVGGYLHSGAIR